MCELSFDVPPRADAIPSIAARVAAFGARRGLDARRCFELQVVVAEALNNVVRHAMNTDRGHGSIALYCTVAVDALEISIVDDGLPLLEQPQCDLPDGRVENGRGWPIIVRWSDAVAYRSVNGRNELILRKRLDAAGERGA